MMNERGFFTAPEIQSVLKELTAALVRLHELRVALDQLRSTPDSPLEDIEVTTAQQAAMLKHVAFLRGPRLSEAATIQGRLWQTEIPVRIAELQKELKSLQDRAREFFKLHAMDVFEAALVCGAKAGPNGLSFEGSDGLAKELKKASESHKTSRPTELLKSIEYMKVLKASSDRNSLGEQCRGRVFAFAREDAAKSGFDLDSDYFDPLYRGGGTRRGSGA